MINYLCGKERTIVLRHPLAPLRDAIDTQIDFQGRDITLTDTAGIRPPQTALIMALKRFLSYARSKQWAVPTWWH